jgi:DNA-binding CsgD family transcriptional regulator
VASRATIVDAVESIYSGFDTAAPAMWLSHVLAQVLACVPGTVGGFAYAYDIGGPPATWRISYPLVHDAPAMMAEHIFRTFETASPEHRAQVLPRLGPAGTYSAVTGSLLTAYGAGPTSRLGVLDAIHVNALDADDRGTLIALTIPEPRRLAPAETRRLSMLAAHVAGARRLFGATRPLLPDAIFEQDGRVAHSERVHEPALPMLRDRLLSVERARRSGADPDDILAAWSALVAGRYTLVGRFDTDGRRYVVAYENRPGVRDPRGLTMTEAAIATWARRGHSQKLIAYELGLSLGAVGGMLARVFHKLRVKSRAELVARLAEPTRVSRVAVAGSELLLFSQENGLPALDRLAGLTAAERDVASRALGGMSNASIARARASSPRTVSNQLSSVFRKLGVASRAELVAWAQPTRGAAPAARFIP